MSEEVAMAIADAPTIARQAEELAAAQATIAGQRRLIDQLKADNAALLEIAKRSGLTYMTYAQAMADIAALASPHPGRELLAELEQQREVITRQVAQTATDHQALTELRAALATAQAELDWYQPIVIAAARLVAAQHAIEPDHEHLRSVLEQARAANATAH